MNTDTKRMLSKFDSRGNSELYQHLSDGQLRIRLTNPSVIITVALLVVSIGYEAIRQQRRLPSLFQLLWDATITVIPARILFAVERFMNPPLFPTHMLKTQPPTRAAKSEALRKILGFDNGSGIIGSVSQAGRRGLSSLSSATRGGRNASDQPPGLGNYDNSCFQNSILQGLAALKPLPAYLSAISLERRFDPSPTSTVDTLRELIAELTSSSSNGKTLWTPKVLKNMNTWQQQDAQEYYSKLLDQIDNEIARATRAIKHHSGLESDRISYDSSVSQHSDDSGYHSFHAHSKPGPEPRIVRNPLEGLMAQRVACVNCGYCEGLNMIPFNCLTLTLGNLPEHDLYERLDNYTKVESIEGVECLKCSLIMCRDLIKALVERTGTLPEFQRRLEHIEEALEEEAFDEETLIRKCGLTQKMRTNSTKTKQVVLARPPQSLVFHVNRSGFDEQTGYMFKNSAAVRFPLMLDLGPWCLGSTDARARLEEGTMATRDVEHWTLDPKASMVAGDREPSRITGPIYELRAVVTHYGRHENGHYVCYRKHPVASVSVMGNNEIVDTPDEPVAQENEVIDATDSGQETKHADEGNSASEADERRSTLDSLPSQWWRLSDEDVYQVDEQTVLSQGGVFMLFYDCVDPNLALVSDIDESIEMEPSAIDVNMSDTAAASCISSQSPGLMQRDESLLDDPNSLAKLDDVPPLPGIPTPTNGTSEEPELAEIANQQQHVSSVSGEHSESLTPDIPIPDPVDNKDDERGQPAAERFTQSTDESRIPQPFSRASEV
ncbi:hypothetical protein C7999DRAFT_11137 [Corynascus novoguineensis]|uniref:ubiquitinyl hydrolase 1 n=1 Tax=Corynascus novoguineensis TaxID=1126955 RepID=A0AAN7CZ93_9PEZI|nr:hypothetical protein C7999DRAFT_11137 [Corynascus novoguineensis]